MLLRTDRMNSKNDNAKNGEKSLKHAGPGVSRRNVLASSAAASAGASIGLPGQAAADGEKTKETPKKDEETVILTIRVTGLEVEGAMGDVEVRVGDETKKTDKDGTARFEVERGTYEVTAYKRRWERKLKTVTADEETQTLHLPMHIREYNGMETMVRDSDRGQSIRDATVRVDREQIRRTDKNGMAKLLLENQLEPFEYEVHVEHDKYRGEKQKMKIDEEDKKLEFHMISK